DGQPDLGGRLQLDVAVLIHPGRDVLPHTGCTVADQVAAVPGRWSRGPAQLDPELLRDSDSPPQYPTSCTASTRAVTCSVRPSRCSRRSPPSECLPSATTYSTAGSASTSTASGGGRSERRHSGSIEQWFR